MRTNSSTLLILPNLDPTNWKLSISVLSSVGFQSVWFCDFATTQLIRHRDLPTRMQLAHGKPPYEKWEKLDLVWMWRGSTPVHPVNSKHHEMDWAHLKCLLLLVQGRSSSKLDIVCMLPFLKSDFHISVTRIIQFRITRHQLLSKVDSLIGGFQLKCEIQNLSLL